MPASSLVVRNAPLFLGALSLGIVAASQGCSPGTLDYPEDFEAEALKYGTGGGGAALPAPKTGGATGSGGAVSTGGAPGSGGALKTCGAMNVTPGCATFDASLTNGACKTCHSKDGATGFMTIDFISDPKGALVGKQAVYGDRGATVGAAACPTTREVLLDPSNFDKSLFVTKIRGSGFACGAKMPTLGTLKVEDLNCLLSWACELSQK